MIKLQLKYIILTFLILTLLSILPQGASQNPNGMTLDKVEIYSVSTRIRKLNYQAKGSLNGGTLIFIKAKGHNITPSQNKIMVGPYPCIVPEKGVSNDLISCRTTKPTNMQMIDGLLVKLLVNGKNPSKCRASSGGCKFTYTRAATPILNFLEPSAQVPKQKINWNAIWRVDTTKDIKKLIIGDMNCNRFELHPLKERTTPTNLNDDQSIRKDREVYIPCEVSEIQTAGVYNVKSETVFGDLYKMPAVKKATADGSSEYEQAIIAQISSIDQNTGGNQGNLLEIKGIGFGQNKKAVSVSVGSLSCSVQEISNEKIICELQSGSTPAAGQGLFQKGQGVKTTKYNFNKAGISSAGQLKNLVKSNSAGKFVMEEYINGDWAASFGDKPGVSRDGVHARGYFKAPRTGAYRFFLAADDTALFYLNQTPNEALLKEENLVLEKCSYTNSRNYFYPNSCGGRQETTVNLTAGSYYWIEVFAGNSNGPGHYALSVETPAPSDGSTLANAMKQLQEIQIKPEKVHQKWSFKMFNSNDPFQFNLRYVNPDNRRVELNASTDQKTWQSWTNEEFVKQINKISQGHGAEFVESHDLDASGNRCTGCTAQGKEIVLQFTLHRKEGKLNQTPTCNQGNVKCRIQKLVEQSDPVSGSYTLSVKHNVNGVQQTEKIKVWSSGDWRYDIPFDIGVYQIFEGLVKLSDKFLGAQYWEKGRDLDGNSYFFWLQGHQMDDLPEFVFDTTNLRGGKRGSTPQVLSKAVISASKNPFYEPIGFDMSFVEADKPQIEVQVNNIVSRCNGNCDYEAKTALTPTLNSFSVSGNTVTMDLSGNSAEITVALLRVWYGGSECVIGNSDLSALSCNVADGIEAGDNKPKVLAKGFGYAGFAGSAVSVAPVVSSLDIVRGSTQGGKVITITGTGFAIKNDVKSVQVTFGSAAATVLSVKNTEIKVKLPKAPNGAQAEDVAVVFNGKKSNTNVRFTYDNSSMPAIASVQIKGESLVNIGTAVKANPVKKQQMTITGSNFGNNVNKLQVWLMTAGGEQKYQLNINALDSSSSMKVTLGGGRVGQYKLRVLAIDLGYSVSDFDFHYEIGINSISPSSGNKYGGQVLTITGYNFGDNLTSNQVFVEQTNNGKFVKAQAYSLQASSTQLKVRLPPMPEGGNINSPFLITVFGRIIEQATCKGSCNFTYVNGTKNPEITTPEITSFKNSQKVTFAGERLPISGSGETLKMKIGSEFEYTMTLKDANSLAEWTVPDDIRPGNYVFSFSLDSLGPIGSFNGKIEFTMTLFEPKGACSIGGNEIVLTGSGFTKDTIVYVGPEKCSIHKQTATEIKCTSVDLKEHSRRENIVIRQLPQEDFNCIGCYEQAKSHTPMIAASNPDNQNNSITLDGSDFKYVIEEKKNWWNNDATAFLQSQEDPRVKIEGVVSLVDGKTTIVFNGGKLMPGRFDVKVHATKYRGYNQFASCVVKDSGKCVGPASFVSFIGEDFSISGGQQTGLGGGTTLRLTGKRLNTGKPENNQVHVCGHPCLVDLAGVTSTSLSCKLPQVNTKFMLDNGYQLAQIDSSRILLNKENLHQSAFQQASSSEIKDKKRNILSRIIEYPVSLLESTTNECWVQFDAQEGGKLFVEKMILRPGAGYDGTSFFRMLKLQARNTDSDSWIDLDTYSPAHISDYEEIVLNTFKGVAAGDLNREKMIKGKLYRQFRIIESQPEGKKASCNFYVEKVVGDVFSLLDVTSDSDFNCGVSVSVNGAKMGIAGGGTVRYQGNAVTAKVNDIIPKYSHAVRPEQITLTGSNFGTNTAAISVKFDGQSCTVNSVKDDEIKCTPPAYSKVKNAQKIEVLLNGKPGILSKNIDFFPGALRWSDVEAWGGEAPPRAGDVVYIPKGQTLIVDESSPVALKTVIVEGTLFFDPNLKKDLTFDAEYIIIRKGNFLVGTERNPFENKLTITLHGKYEGKQLPEFGNKVIGCHTCKIDLFGKRKRPHMALLAETANKGDDTIKVDQHVSWTVGDYIGIATTDFMGSHSEKVKITAISNSGSQSVLTIEPALKHKHLGEIETYGSEKLVMKAEVVLLSSNVVIQGDPEDSLQDNYGAHLMIHGREYDGTQARIDSIEFKHTGQPKIVGRYSVHFHMVGDAPSSYVKNIKVHDAFARVVALHATNYLTVQNNVGFNVKGHNIFLEDGVETNNVIEGNCLIYPRSAFNMLQTDITVAGIWVTNPSNYVRNNYVSGSQFYGLWYEIKQFSETRSDICPIGMPVLQLENNVAHSNVRFGLRFFNLQPRVRPCSAIKNVTADNTFLSDNASVQYVYKNHTLYKNGESGLLAEFLGNSIFEGVKLADNYRAGFQAHAANFTQEPVVLRDSLIVGKTASNGEKLDYQQNAIILPRTYGFLAKNVKIYNFEKGTNIVESSSENGHALLMTQGGYSNELEGISLSNCNDAQKVNYVGPRTNFIVDKDGSLTGRGVKNYIAPFNAQFNKVISDGGCRNETKSYNTSVVCSQTVKAIKFGNLVPYETFLGQKMFIANLNDKSASYNYTDLDSPLLGSSVNMKLMNADGKSDFVALLAVDYTYQIQFNEGMDWDHMLVYPSYDYGDDEKSIILRFKYTKEREVFDVFRMHGGKLGKQFKQKQSLDSFVNSVTLKPNNDPKTGCKNGDWYNDEDNRQFYLCVNGKGREGIYHQQIDVNAVTCRDLCVTEGDFSCSGAKKPVRFIEKDSTRRNAQYVDKSTGKAVRKLPSETEWSYGVPRPGDDVQIPCDWKMIYNTEEFEFGTLYIDGNLQIDTSLSSVKIKANNIWLRGGKITVGSEKSPYKGKFEIELIGGNNSPSLLVDDLAKSGTKAFVVTGQLELFGKVPSTTQTRLTKIANKGDNTIKVQDDISDWQIGDELVIGGNQKDGLGYEKVTIASKDEANKVITLKQPIQHWHYGHPYPTIGTNNNNEVKIDGKYGSELDFRASVGHISRNIRIYGSSEDSLGGHLQIYHYIYNENGVDVNERGNAVLKGVEFENMGQKNGENAGIHVTYTNLNGKNSTAVDTVIEGSAVHDCNGICFSGFKSKKVKLENNVFYNGQKFLISAIDSTEYTIKNNLLIGAKKRTVVDLDESGRWDPVALIYMYTPYLPSVDKHDVQGNVGQSSQGIGYAFPATPCTEKSQVQFVNNEFGYSPFVGVLFNLKEDMCYHLGHVSVHNSEKGVIINNSGAKDGYDATKFIIAECQTNLVLHSGSSSTIHNNFLSNTWVSAMVRPTCTSCYTKERLQKNSRCSNNYAIQLHITTNSGESFPFRVTPFEYEVVCTATSPFGSVYWKNVELHNYYDTYPSAQYPNAGLCKHNTGMKPSGGASDATPAHYFKDVKCTNCDLKSLFYIQDPSSGWRGWFGGCGNMDCTGLENVLIQDLTGDLLGHVGSVISNNEDIAGSDYVKKYCSFVKEWNAFKCTTTEFALLEWEGVSVDRAKKVPVPVTISNEHFSHKLNIWREWGWLGSEPMNTRFNRFVALATANKRHNIVYNGTQCLEMVHKLSQRSVEGEKDRFVILNVKYDSPLALEAVVDGKVVEAFQVQGKPNLEKHSSVCGANIYYHQNNTIQFVVTNVQDCLVKIRQRNTVTLSMRMSMTAEEFYSDSAYQTNFIDRLAKFLGIDFSRIRIVGASNSSGSRRILSENKAGSDLKVLIVAGVPGNANNGYDADSTYKELQGYAKKVEEGVNKKRVDLGVPVSGVKYQMNVIKDAEGNSNVMFTEKDLKKVVQEKSKEEEEESSSAVAVALGIIFGILGAITIISVVYLVWRHKQLKKIHNVQVAPSISDVEGNQEKQIAQQQQQLKGNYELQQQSDRNSDGMNDQNDQMGLSNQSETQNMKKKGSEDLIKE